MELLGHLSSLKTCAHKSKQGSISVPRKQIAVLQAFNPLRSQRLNTHLLVKLTCETLEALTPFLILRYVERKDATIVLHITCLVFLWLRR